VRLTRRDRLVLFAPAIALVSLGLLVPALLGLMATFTTYSPFGSPLQISGLSNYAAVFTDPAFTVAIRNITIFTVTAVPLELVVGFGLAYILRRPIRGRGLWRVLLLVPWLVSPIASGVMWRFLLGTANGIVDFVLGWLGRPDASSPIADVHLALAASIAVEVWRMAPFVAFLLLPGLLAIPPEQFEEANLNGASWFHRVKDIAVPALRPLFFAIAMLLIGLSLGTFDSILILTGGGPGTSTTTPALYSYNQAFIANNWPLGAASAWLIAAGVLVTGLVYLRLSRTRSEQ
jgi:multiple sugar transport system permease protein